MNKKLENEYGNGGFYPNVASSIFTVLPGVTAGCLSTERFYGNQVPLSEDKCFQVFRKYWCW